LVEGAHVRRELRWYWRDHAFLRPRADLRLRQERANLAALRRAVRDLRPEVASVWHMAGLSLQLLTALEEEGIPLVLNVCDAWPSYGPKADAWTSLTRHWPMPRVLGVPTRLPRLDSARAAFVSQALLDDVRARGPWRFPSAVVVGSGIDPDDFPVLPAPPSKEWQGRVVVVGRIEARKGADVVVRALDQLPDATLRLVGPPRDDYLEDLRALGRFTTESLPRSQLRQVYADADVLVFPVRWEEPFGLVPLEAMSQGVPVVATRTGGAADFLEHEVNCLAVPVDDSDAVAAAVRRLADDPALRTRLVSAGLDTAARYGVDVLASRLEELHQPPLVTAPVEDRLASSAWGQAARVSVVVSTHSRCELLAGLLARLDAQRGAELEVVAVDNGSADGTWPLLASWCASTQLPALVLRLGFHDGPAVPRNTAIALSSAPLLAFTDDDCLPVAGWATSLVAPLADEAVAVVQGRTLPEPDGWAGPWGRSLTVTGVTGLSETANLACRRRDLVAVGGFPAERVLGGRAFGEDVLLGAALSRTGTTTYAPDALVHHRVLPGSYRDFVRERQRLGGFAHLARTVPVVRRQRWLGLFLSRRTAAVDLGLLGLVAAARGRRAGLVLALPWAVLSWRAASGRPGRPRAVRAAQVAAADVVAASSLVVASARSGRAVL
jgi:glycosyltransferase involved in cell wall biosynthesis